MNKIHNIIWSKAQSAWVVVAEGTKASSKAGGGALKVMIALIMLTPVAGMAATLPQGGSISVGQGTIVTNGSNQMIIKQTTDRLGINWQSFNVGADGHVVFDQPGAKSVALNRVIGSDGSSILGKIDANGQVFLINPNGVIFGKDSKVNVGGLVASTLDITDKDFEAGHYKFASSGSTSGITNLGAIAAADGGFVALIGKSVTNQGVVQAKLGTAALTAGEAVTLDFTGDGLLNIQVDKSVVNALVENKGLIKADGGNVLMTARASNNLTQTVVNNEGIIEAQTIGTRAGKIFLDGGMETGIVRVAGTLDASAPSTGDGGFIETSGAVVTVADSTKVTTKATSGKTGKWLIDPTDFTISGGGGALTSSGIGAATLTASLASTNVELQTTSAGTEDGDINVNADVSWNANTTLTLTAHGTINLNADITANGDSGGVALNYSTTTYNIAEGHSINLVGDNTTYSENGDNVIILRTVDDLLKLNDSDYEWDRFALAGNIDASITSTWNGGLGYAPAVMDGTFFGHLNGLGHSVNNLYINRPSESNVGLIGNMQYSKVSNISVNGSVTGKDNVGMVIGASEGGTITNLSTSGSVSGQNNVGGVAGFIDSGKMIKAHSSADVNGVSTVGGVIGSVLDNSLRYLYSTGNVAGTDVVGGVIGRQDSSSLEYAYSHGNVNGGSTVGGLIGYSASFDIEKAYASGDVTGSGDNVGGLVGKIYDGAITESFATSKVSGRNDVGGLVGNADKVDLESVYATGAVSGDNNVGGLAGFTNNVYLDYTYSSGLVTSSGVKGGHIGASVDLVVNEAYWDTTLSGLMTSAGGVGYAKLTDSSIFSNWDLAVEGGSGSPWRMYDGLSGPLLRAFMGSAIAAPGSAQSTTYNGTNVTTSDVSLDPGSISYGSGSSFFKLKAGQVFASATQNGQVIRNAGSYVLDGFYSTQFGYDIEQSARSTLVVDKAHLDIDAIGDSKTYDGNVSAGISFKDIRFGSDDLVIAGTATFSDKNTGSGKAITVNGVAVSGADASNYTWDATTTTTADINARRIWVDAIASDKVYDGSDTAQVSLTAGNIGSDPLNTGLIAGDDLQLSGDGRFSEKNAGSGKAVTVSDVVLGGADALNYILDGSASSVSTTAAINKASLTITADGISKTYDGTAVAGVSFDDDRIAGDDLTVTSSASVFSDNNVGEDKSISISGISVSGADANNYTVSSTTTATANIDKANLVVKAENGTKVEGAIDVQLKWSLQNGNLFGSDAILGELSRDAGEVAGLYGIHQGDLTAGSNYALSVVPGRFEITEIAKPPVVVDPIQPPVIVDPVNPPAVDPANAGLESAKGIISTVSVATNWGRSASKPLVAANTNTSSILADYRLLNLGMKLPDDMLSDQATTFQVDDE